ncbi:MAG: hypothetical protein OXC83_09370 [Chloroflexi bacterium]|nr:hypothetical protein [Chloroflexota bacterium]
MLNLPRRPTEPKPSIYESLGVRDLPFSPNPVLNPYSQDPRVNGMIYAQPPVREAIRKFENLLIRPEDFDNRVKMASVWATGDVQSGRGMGKTALLSFFRQRINNDWGLTEFAGRLSAAVIYASFPSAVDRRWMEQLAWAALVDTCNNGVLTAARAALRRDVLTDDEISSIVDTEDGENWGNLFDTEVLKANGISSTDLDDAVEATLRQEGVEAKPASALARGSFDEFLRDLRRDHNLVPYYVPRDTKGLDYARDLFFNEIVLFLRAAGFAGGYLFVDDIENLTDQMPRRHRTEFAKEFGLCMVRPGYANSDYGFFSCVLTTHQQSALALATAWNEAGLSGMARLDPGAPTSVELPEPTPDQARQILVAHLDHYRVDPTNGGSIKPFTEDGLGVLLSRSRRPRDLLSSASSVVRFAAERRLTTIDAETVHQALTGELPINTVDYTEGLDAVL